MAPLEGIDDDTLGEAGPAPTAELRRPGTTTLNALLGVAREAGASDVYLGAGSIPFARIEGELRRYAGAPLTAAEAEALAAQARAKAGIEDASGLDLDCCIEIGNHGRFRANLHRHSEGAGLSLKCIPREVRSLEQLGLPESLYALTEFRTGMVLVTGPAGCGKSSTLAALLQRINESRPEHIVTIEDPIEFVFPSLLANITQRELGRHTESFHGALRAALREDPDVILVSELRDLETVRTAIVAAETGHLVLGTLHTRNAAGTVRRLLDVFPAREQEQVRAMLSESLRAVVSQELLPRADGGTRVPAYEILLVTPAVSTLIRDGRTHQIPSVLQIGRKQGMIDKDTRLGEMVRSGLISAAVARRTATNPARFKGDADAS